MKDSVAIARSLMTRRLVPLLILAQAGCGDHVPGTVRVSQERDQFVQEFIWALWVNDPAQLLYLSPRVLQMPGIVDSLAVVRNQFPIGEPQYLELVGAGLEARGAWARQFISYQLRGDGGWAGIEALVIQRDEEMYIDLLQATPFPASLQELNALTLRGKPLSQLLFFVMLGCTFLFCLTVAGMVARTPMRHRWWWAFVALIGVGQVAVDWTSGEILTRPFFVLLLSAGLERDGQVGPWIMSIAFPVGAILALERRRRALGAIRSNRQILSKQA